MTSITNTVLDTRAPSVAVGVAYRAACPVARSVPWTPLGALKFSHQSFGMGGSDINVWPLSPEGWLSG